MEKKDVSVVSIISQKFQEAKVNWLLVRIKKLQRQLIKCPPLSLIALIAQITIDNRYSSPLSKIHEKNL